MMFYCIWIKYPDTSADVILTVRKCSKFSGYKINLDKSQALYMYAPSESPFHLGLSRCKYLGINIIPNLEDLFKANYSPLITKIYHNLSESTLIFFQQDKYHKNEHPSKITFPIPKSTMLL